MVASEISVFQKYRHKSKPGPSSIRKKNENPFSVAAHLFVDATTCEAFNAGMKRILAVLLLTLAAPAWGQDFEKGWAAYKRGDYATALREFLPLANQGLAFAQYTLGRMYAEGQGVVQDYAEALKWYRKATEQGSALAQTSLGVMYERGQGVTQDYAEALKWYRKAAEQGLATAQTNLGFMYMNGRGVPQDDAEALKWTRKAAEQGDARGQTQLGIVYYLGQGVPQDYVRAHMWFNLSAAQGNKDGAKGRDIITKLMTPAQIAEAQRLAREWMAKHGKKK